MFAVGGQPHVSQGFTQRPLSSVNIQFDQTWDYPKGLWYRIWGDIVNSNSTSCAHSSTKITKHETVALKQTLFSSYGEGLSLDHSYRRRFGHDSRSWKNFFEGWPLKRSRRRLLDVELAISEERLVSTMHTNTKLLQNLSFIFDRAELYSMRLLFVLTHPNLWWKPQSTHVSFKTCGCLDPPLVQAEKQFFGRLKQPLLEDFWWVSRLAWHPHVRLEDQREVFVMFNPWHVSGQL